MEADFQIDFGPFSEAVKKLKAANKEIMPGQIARALLFEWIRKILLKWPVLSGRSRAGWSAGARFSGNRVPGGPDAQAIIEGAAKSGLTITTDGDRVIYEVTNAVEYAEELESGSSKQAPMGAVEISLRELEIGRTPDDVMDAYAHLWDMLGKSPGSVEIRASDVRAALRIAGVPVSDG